MLTSPEQLNLSNWRLPGNGRWAFHHVREVVPSEQIGCAAEAAPLPSAPNDSIAGLSMSGLENAEWSLQDWLEVTHGDALLVAHRGKLVHEWYAHAGIETNPHIVFSVSKSMTATLAGVLVEQGLLDPARPVVEYLPELAGSGYSDASLQQVLDMAAAAGVDGLSETPALTPKDLISCSVRWRWGPASACTVMMSDPASTNASI